MKKENVCKKCGKSPVLHVGLCSSCYWKDYKKRKKKGKVYKTGCDKSNKTRMIEFDLILGELTDSQIARKHSVSPAWIFTVKKRMESEQK